MRIETIATARLAEARAAYTTRRLDLSGPATVLTGPDVAPRPGDLVLARVTALGQHTRIELPTGRRASLYVGDEVVVAYAHRYAPDQFESEIPTELGECHLVAAGGVASRVLSQHAKMKPATTLQPVGLLADGSGRRRNVADGALRPRGAWPRPAPVTIVVAGTSMNSGKTTTVAALVHGLTAAGMRVGAAKVTGTGAGGDPWLFRDSGAAEVLDFVDAGFATTYRVPASEVVGILTGVHGELAARGVDAVVIEIADGALQQETAALLREPALRDVADGMVFAAGDALGAINGVQGLQALGLPVLAAAGVLTSSPLATREAQGGLDVPVYTLDDLSDPALAVALADRAGLARRVGARAEVLV